jgi:hypothetical protein
MLALRPGLHPLARPAVSATPIPFLPFSRSPSLGPDLARLVWAADIVPTRARPARSTLLAPTCDTELAASGVRAHHPRWSRAIGFLGLLAAGNRRHLPQGRCCPGPQPTSTLVPFRPSRFARTLVAPAAVRPGQLPPVERAFSEVAWAPVPTRRRPWPSSAGRAGPLLPWSRFVVTGLAGGLRRRGPRRGCARPTRHDLTPSWRRPSARTLCAAGPSWRALVPAGTSGPLPSSPTRPWPRPRTLDPAAHLATGEDVSPASLAGVESTHVARARSP